MAASSSHHKRKALFLAVLFITLFAFTADILDLREELHILACPYSSLDSNVTTGVVYFMAVVPEPIFTACPVQGKTSVEISFIHLLPYGFRAPPPRS